MPTIKNIAQKRARKILRLDYGVVTNIEFNELVKVDNEMMEKVNMLFLGGSNIILNSETKFNITEKRWSTNLENAFKDAIKYSDNLGGGVIYALSFEVFPNKKECFSTITAETPYLKTIKKHNDLRESGNIEEFNKGLINPLYKDNDEVDLLDVEFDRQRCKIPKKILKKVEVKSNMTLDEIKQKLNLT